ncbi:hypothetical protein TUM19329_19300 [Legionella antarctica]|uniref:Uncharacterized protein n=1 Tax=Legionella antarctica TaxID=2708020 RepID=A0A6F8T544_9GAMM|nr:hypothetical protein [Legionella antarctica]BCA95569.1 hypothetical protein TUM19329_19300 [Legionella antarctica]
MTLSISNKKLLRDEYDKLTDYLDEQNKTLWLPLKENIIDFCIENDMHLYNIGSLRVQWTPLSRQRSV